jgi:hypothetical protein
VVEVGKDCLVDEEKGKDGIGMGYIYIFESFQ